MASIASFARAESIFGSEASDAATLATTGDMTRPDESTVLETGATLGGGAGAGAGACGPTGAGPAGAAAEAGCVGADAGADFLRTTVFLCAAR